MATRRHRGTTWIGGKPGRIIGGRFASVVKDAPIDAAGVLAGEAVSGLMRSLPVVGGEVTIPGTAARLAVVAVTPMLGEHGRTVAAGLLARLAKEWIAHLSPSVGAFLSGADAYPGNMAAYPGGLAWWPTTMTQFVGRPWADGLGIVPNDLDSSFSNPRIPRVSRALLDAMNASHSHAAEVGKFFLEHPKLASGLAAMPAADPDETHFDVGPYTRRSSAFPVAAPSHFQPAP